MTEENSSDKQYDPSPKKLLDARRKGEIPRSTDINTAAAYLGLLLFASSMGAGSIAVAGATMAGFLSGASALADAVFSGPSPASAFHPVKDLAWTLSAWFAAPAFLVIASLLAQNAIVLAPDRVKGKLSRLDPVANAKQKFGRVGLFEFAKSVVKLSVFSAVLALFLLQRSEGMIASTAMQPGQSLSELGRLCIEFLALVFAVSLAIGSLDLLWQRAEHFRKHRMTRKEMTDEHKESEGDPQMRQSRRQRARDTAMNRMMHDVPTADVVIVNPTHYAVALRWSRLPGEAPICVAKGVDETARRIRELAIDSGVPVHSDPPTARAIHATIDIGGEIAQGHYRAVAAAIRFAESIREAKGKGPWH